MQKFFFNKILQLLITTWDILLACQNSVFFNKSKIVLTTLVFNYKQYQCQNFKI